MLLTFAVITFLSSNMFKFLLGGNLLGNKYNKIKSATTTKHMRSYLLFLPDWHKEKENVQYDKLCKKKVYCDQLGCYLNTVRGELRLYSFALLWE